jgi:hypothetical protein
MTTIARSPARTARRSRRSSTGHRGARPDAPLGLQLDRPSPVNATAFGWTDPLANRNALDQHARSSCHNSGTASAAIKSP